MKKDIFGQTEVRARKLFGKPHTHSKIALVSGIWLASWPSRKLDSRGRLYGKPQRAYAGLNADGKLRSHGTRRATVAASKES